jgi:hypothetical protein
MSLSIVRRGQLPPRGESGGKVGLLRELHPRPRGPAGGLPPWPVLPDLHLRQRQEP